MAANQRVVNTVAVLAADEKKLQAELEGSSLQLKLLAEAMEKEGKGDKVSFLESMTGEVVGVAHEMAMHQKAMKAVAEEYAYSGEPTNFEELLQQQLAAEMAQQPEPTENHILDSFQQAIRALRASDCDDDDELMMTTQVIVKNFKCPITMKPVEELRDPVCCLDCRHVYERGAVEQMLLQSTKCPYAGCPQLLTRARLVCDTQLQMALRELKARRATATAAETVEEVDEL